MRHAVMGLSPRVRGNLCAFQCYGESIGQRSIPACAGEPQSKGCSSTTISAIRSIPACAGEPDDTSDDGAADEVYPRVCGGTHQGCPDNRYGKGLSPRVRGNRSKKPFGGLATTVYPRVCGGTRLPGPYIVDPIEEGLSPRVRGNLNRQGANLGDVRSIPACAGEPPRQVADAEQKPVYPRVCGGTCSRCSQTRRD